jgi:aspartate-semialdehyde dehydrogenase
VVGATGAVGQEFLRLFEERDFPVSELRLLASARSVGKTFRFRGAEIPVQEARPDSFEGIRHAFFSAGASRSRELVPHALNAGAYVYDNSSAFRMDPNVPLVVPEVNWHSVRPEDRLFSVPNCTAILLLVVVHPLRALEEIDRLIVSTYQSASGGGAQVMQELIDETREALNPGSVGPIRKVLPHPYAFNVFSHNTKIGPDGSNEEETKVVEESRKILGMPNLRINVTCVRVPVLRAHTETVTVEFRGAAPSEEAVRRALANAPGVRVVDDREANHFPMPVEASGQGDVLVGRIRKDPTCENGIRLMLSGDQLLKGAALNAVQIAERIVARDA